jgi:hypothetical protein
MANDEQDLAEIIRERYYRNRYRDFDQERSSERKTLPYPYWGRDVVPRV